LEIAEAERNQVARESVKTAKTAEDLAFITSWVGNNPSAHLGILRIMMTKRKESGKANMKSAHCHETLLDR
jgi:hypothetical protein